MPTQIVQNAKNQLLTDAQGIVTQLNIFKNKDNNKVLLAADPAANNLIIQLESLAKNLEAVLDAMDGRIQICEEHSGVLGKLWRVAHLEISIKPMVPMLESLVKVQKDMAALKAAAMVAGNSALAQEVREIFDNFIKELLKKDSILYKLIDALDLGTALSLLDKGLGKVGLNAEFEKKIKGLLKQAKFENLDDPACIKSFFKVVLPELMTKAGKQSLSEDLTEIPELHEKHIDEMKSCLEPSNVSVEVISSSSSTSSAVVSSGIGKDDRKQERNTLLPNSPSASMSWRESLSKHSYTLFVVTDLISGGVFSRMLPAAKETSNSSTSNNSAMLTVVPEVPPLQAFITELEKSNVPNSPKYLSNILILSEIKSLFLHLKTLTLVNKQVSYDIQKATVQFVKDMHDESKEDKNEIERAYREKLASNKNLPAEQLNQDQVKALEETINALIEQARKQEATLHDLILVLRLPYPNTGLTTQPIPQELENLIHKITKLSNHLNGLDKPKVATEIQKQMVQFLIKTIASISASGNRIDSAQLSSAINDLNLQLASSLALLSPKNREIICGLIGAVIFTIAFGGIVFAVAGSMAVFGTILVGGILGSSATTGGVLGRWAGYTTSSYVKIIDVKNDIEQAVPAENTAFKARSNKTG